MQIYFIHSESNKEKYRKIRSIRSQIFFKVGVLRNFAIFTRKNLWGGLFLTKLQVGKPATLLLSSEYCEIFQSTFFVEHLRWLLLENELASYRSCLVVFWYKLSLWEVVEFLKIRLFSCPRAFRAAITLTLFRIDIGCSQMMGEEGKKTLILPKICHTYPTMTKLGTVISYLKKIQSIYKSHDKTLEFCWH